MLKRRNNCSHKKLMKRLKLQRNKKTSKAGNLILRRGKARCNQNCPLESTLPLRHASVLTACVCNLAMCMQITSRCITTALISLILQLELE